mmetsp:Transcript_26865/g.89434  ORF Transcript_26865/g.89434 Transcript_26865/m.89434 type:complete len:95 (-) Transcript_26865:98-382(-)
MGFAACTLGGSAFGVWTMIYCNALRKAPYFHRPWEHVLAAGFFAYLANRTSTLSDFLGERLDAGVMEQLKQNQGKFDEKYKAILGEKGYKKIFG